MGKGKQNMTNEEQEQERKQRLEARREARKAYQQRQKKRRQRILVVLVAVCGLIIGAGTELLIRTISNPHQVELSTVAMPDWVDVQLIRENEYSRPGKRIERVNGIVIHYVANKGTSAQNNRNYFDNLADQKKDKAELEYRSSNFIVGLQGEVIQCIPINEVAYASNNRNSDTLSIETCHPDETGKYNQDTYDSLVELTAWLCYQLNLDEKDVIRHYDITGKDCPRYFVQDEAAWEQFRADVKKKIKSFK